MDGFNVRPPAVTGMSQLAGRATEDARAAVKSIQQHYGDTGGSVVSWWYHALSRLQERAVTDSQRAATLLDGMSRQLNAAATYYSKVDARSKAQFVEIDRTQGTEGALPGYLAAYPHISYQPSEVTRPETSSDFKDAVDATPAPVTKPTAADVDLGLFLDVKTLQSEILNKASFSHLVRDLVHIVSMHFFGIDVIAELNKLFQGDWEGLGLHARGLGAAATTFDGIHDNLIRGAYALQSAWTGKAADAFLYWNHVMLNAAQSHSGFLKAVSDATVDFAKNAYHEYDAINSALDAVIDLVASIYTYGASDALGAIWRVLSDPTKLSSVTSALYNLLAAIAENISKVFVALNALRAIVSKLLAAYHFAAGTIKASLADATNPVTWPDAPYHHHGAS